MDISRRQVAVYAAVALVLFAGVAAAVHISGTVPTSGTVPLQSADGTTVFVEGATNQLMEENFPTSSQVEVITEAGNATFTASGSANVTIHKDEIEGPWTNITSVDADPNVITVDPGDKNPFVVGKAITSASVSGSISADDGNVDFAYTASADGRVTVQGLPTDTEMRAVDANTNTILEYSTSDPSGVVTFDTLDSGDHDVVIQTGSPAKPTFSNPDPTGMVSSAPSDISIDINDSEFPNGDSVTAELFVDGTSEGTDTLTSNGTATVPVSIDLGSTVTYNWTATDSFGASNTSQDYTLSTPENLTIREENNASDIVTGADATVTFYSTDAEIVVERTDSDGDGNLSLSGLPNKEFVAVIEANNYYTRRVYIESIYQQQNVFILNQTEVPPAEVVNTTFTFEDRTGNFDPEDTTLRIQRALDINDDDEFEWMTVAGDFWGAAAEFPFTGEENARYRLIVENQNGERRVLGTHIPTSDGIKQIVNGEIRFEAGNATGRYFDANLSEADENIQVLYQDPTNGTGDVRVRIWELGNQSNEIHDQNYTNTPYGRLVTTVDLTSDQTGNSWVVKFDATHDEDGAIDGRVTVGGVGIPLPIDPWLLASFGVIGLTFVGCLYGPRTSTMGAWMLVLVATGLTAFGWVGFPYASLVVAVAIAAGVTFYREAIPT